MTSECQFHTGLRVQDDTGGKGGSSGARGVGGGLGDGEGNTSATEGISAPQNVYMGKDISRDAFNARVQISCAPAHALCDEGFDTLPANAFHINFRAMGQRLQQPSSTARGHEDLGCVGGELADLQPHRVSPSSMDVADLFHDYIKGFSVAAINQASKVWRTSYKPHHNFSCLTDALVHCPLGTSFHIIEMLMFYVLLYTPNNQEPHLSLYTSYVTLNPEP